MVYKALPNVQPGRWRELVLSGLPTRATRPCAYRLHSSMGEGGAGEKPSCQDLVGSEWDIADELVLDT